MYSMTKSYAGTEILACIFIAIYPTIFYHLARTYIDRTFRPLVTLLVTFFCQFSHLFGNLVHFWWFSSFFADLVTFFADLVTCSQFSHWMYFPLSLLEQIVCTHIYNYICFTKIALISLQWTIFTQISFTFSHKPPIQHTFSQKRWVSTH